MKKHIFTFCLLFIAALSGVYSQTLQALFAYSTFMLHAEKPYIETYLSFNGQNVALRKNTHGNYQATIEITLVVKKADSIVYAEKRNLLSPEVKDSLSKDFTFMDVQRISLENGIYEFEITLVDKNNPDIPVRTEEKVIINYPKDTPLISDIQFVSSTKPTTKQNILSKNGYDIEPYVSDFFPEKMNTLSYYVEFYNIASVVGMGKSFLVCAYIESYESGGKMEPYQFMKREYAKNSNAILWTFKTDSLPSGNYNLKIELRDTTNNTFLYKKIFFQRSNPRIKANTNNAYGESTSFARSITNDSTLTFYIQSLIHIANEMEKDFILNTVKKVSLEEKQDFFDGFWLLRNQKNPKAEWMKYYDKLIFVEKNYVLPFKKGYLTDRGRVYLIYGAPNHIIDEKFKTSPGIGGNNRAAYLPYQIWRYDNNIKQKQGKGMFIFWAPQSSPDYFLLNSNVEGEINEPYWESRLSRGEIPQGEQGEAGRQFERGY